MSENYSNFVLTFDLYSSLIIPISNFIIHRLLNFKLTKFNFTPTYQHVSSKVSYLNQQDHDGFHYDGSGASPTHPNALHLSTGQCNNRLPESTLTLRMKNGFTDALRAISTCDINPELVNATSFSAYLRICQFLHIRMINPADKEQCLSCHFGLSSCKCYDFKFEYLQWITCDCFFSKYGMCQCEIFPEMFLDIDVLRHYQEYVVLQFLESNLECLRLSDQCTTTPKGSKTKMTHTCMLGKFRLSTGPRCHMLRCMYRRLSEFLPP